MQITIDPNQERFIAEQARAHGFDDPGEFIKDLIHRQWQRDLAAQLGISLTEEERAAAIDDLREGAIERYDEDLAMAEEWRPVEEPQSWGVSRSR